MGNSVNGFDRFSESVQLFFVRKRNRRRAGVVELLLLLWLIIIRFFPGPEFNLTFSRFEGNRLPVNGVLRDWDNYFG